MGFVNRIKHRIGRRGAFLLFLTLVDLIIAYGLIAPLPYGLSKKQIYPQFEWLMDIKWWGLWWFITGVTCFLGALYRKVDRVAFTAAALTNSLWGSLYIMGWVTGILDWRSGLSAIVWLAFAATVLVISGWPEPLTVNGFKVETE